MKKIFYFPVIVTIALGLTATSCGPSKKLTASRLSVEKLQKDSTNTHRQLNDCNAQLRDYNVQVKNLKDQKTTLLEENTSVHNDLNTLSSESQLTIADQQKQLTSFQNMIKVQRDAMSKLKNSISDALMNYKTDELYVYIKDGNVYVSMEEKLLFKSGSDIVDPKGREALKTLAVVLNSTKDITVMIEGHTDNVPISTGKFNDNWDLSTARATSIVRILANDYSFDSKRITASGKGEFHPIKTNDTEVGRAGNRRTEVILSPDMKGIYELLNQ